MRLAKVLGQVVCTVREPGLANYTLLVLQDAPAGTPDQPAGADYVAVDLVGAGTGEVVLVTTGSAALVAAGREAPTDAAVVGIADSVVQSGDVTYRKV